jgi:hypothetical protein
MKFPSEVLGGGHFEEIFTGQPNIVEFVDSLWIEDKTDGIFLEFLQYVKGRLADSSQRDTHELRCREYVLANPSCASYMMKYK